MRDSGSVATSSRLDELKAEDGAQVGVEVVEVTKSKWDISCCRDARLVAKGSKAYRFVGRRVMEVLGVSISS